MKTAVQALYELIYRTPRSRRRRLGFGRRAAAGRSQQEARAATGPPPPPPPPPGFLPAGDVVLGVPQARILTETLVQIVWRAAANIL